MPAANSLLQARHSPKAQQRLLSSYVSKLRAPSFDEQLQTHHLSLRADVPSVMQINLGKMCNQTCLHCHVDAGPTRKEIMSDTTMRACLNVLHKTPISTVDLTGGAPEMNPHFRWLVESIHAIPSVEKIIVRSNLTILLANPKYRDLPTFFAQHGIEVVSSLPHFSDKRTDAQRGKGVFAQSIEALQRLNAIGYGQLNSGLILNLAYNPSGAFLPGSQHTLEQTFKQQLLRKYGIVFNRLLAITNMPIARFLDYLEASDNLKAYMDLLISHFNPHTIADLMCKNTLSVGWDGQLYDCDFNQMLEIPCATAQHISEWDMDKLQNRPIRTAEHCYGCTAGAGSSCAGSLSEHIEKINTPITEPTL